MKINIGLRASFKHPKRESWVTVNYDVIDLDLDGDIESQLKAGEAAADKAWELVKQRVRDKTTEIVNQ